MPTLYEPPGTMPDAEQADERPAHLRALVEASALSQAEVAKAIGVDERTFRRYMSGESRIPYPVQFTVECLVAGIRHEKRHRNLKGSKATALLGELAELQAELPTLPGASRAYQRCAADIRAISRELKRRASK